MALIGFNQTSVRNYHSTLRNIAADRRLFLNLGGRQTGHNILFILTVAQKI
jgi:hypothetical protein